MWHNLPFLTFLLRWLAGASGVPGSGEPGGEQDRRGSLDPNGIAGSCSEQDDRGCLDPDG